jgi:chromosome partitioning protein
VHLAAYLQQRATAALIDGDDNNSATAWAKRGSLPCPVVDARQTARVARQYEHLIIDTPARPSLEDLRELVGGCDLLVIPSTPDARSLDALMLTSPTQSAPLAACHALSHVLDGFGLP